MDKMPLAKVILYKDPAKKSCSWMVVQCPFCSKIHFHGAGGYDEKASVRRKEYLGIRVPHCYTNDSNYKLSWYCGMIIIDNSEVGKLISVLRYPNDLQQMR